MQPQTVDEEFSDHISQILVSGQQLNLSVYSTFINCNGILQLANVSHNHIAINHCNFGNNQISDLQILLYKILKQTID